MSVLDPRALAVLANARHSHTTTLTRLYIVNFLLGQKQCLHGELVFRAHFASEPISWIGPY